MKKRPTATPVSSIEGSDWVMLWIGHLLIPWCVPFHFFRKLFFPRKRQEDPKKRQSNLRGFKKFFPKEKCKYHLNSS